MRPQKANSLRPIAGVSAQLAANSDTAGHTLRICPEPQTPPSSHTTRQPAYI